MIPWDTSKEIPRNHDPELTKMRRELHDASFSSDTLFALDPDDETNHLAQDSTIYLERANLRLEFTQPGSNSAREGVDHVTIRTLGTDGKPQSYISLSRGLEENIDGIIDSFQTLGVVQEGSWSYVHGDDLLALIKEAQGYGASFYSDLGDSLSDLKLHYNIETDKKNFCPAETKIAREENVIRITTFSPSGNDTTRFQLKKDGGMEEISIALTAAYQSGTVWVDIENPTSDGFVREVLERLTKEKEMTISDSDIEYLENFEQNGKIDQGSDIVEREKHLLFTSYALDPNCANPFKFVSHPVRHFVTDDIVLTVHNEDIPALTNLQKLYSERVKGVNNCDFEEMTYDAEEAILESNYKVIQRAVHSVPRAIERLRKKVVKLSAIEALTNSLERSHRKLSDLIHSSELLSGKIANLKHRTLAGRPAETSIQNWKDHFKRTVRMTSELARETGEAEKYIAGVKTDKANRRNGVALSVGVVFVMFGTALQGLGVANDMVNKFIGNWFDKHTNFLWTPYAALGAMITTMVVTLGSGGFIYKMIERRTLREDNDLKSFDDLG